MQIIVLGMHRSGTSSVARLLNMMGVYFGPEGIEMPAHTTNPKGFWERKDVNQLCIQFLSRARCNWNRLSKFNLDQIPAEALDEFRERARQIILGLDAHRPWFLKEPRLCVLAPLWLELLETPICLFVSRSPLEVAKSLSARDGFSIPFGLALWERYLTAALNATIGLPRLQVDHRALMQDPVAVVGDLKKNLESLGVPNLRLPADAEIRAFVDPSLYRAKETRSSSRIKLTKAQAKLWHAFESGTALRSKGQLQFSAEAQTLLLEHDHSIEIQQQVLSFEERNLKLSSQLAEASLQVRRSEDEVRALKAAKEKADRTTFIAQQIHDAILRGVQTLRQAAKADAARDAEIARLRQIHLDASAELQRREAELARLRQDQATAAAELSARHSQVSELSRDKARAEDELRQRDFTLAKLREEHEQAERSAHERAEEIARLSRGLEERTTEAEARYAGYRQLLDDRDRSLTQLHFENEELRRRNRILKKGIDKIEAYFARLRESRSFSFMVYTARRLGLVSRTPRRYVELIKNQFPAVRKALKEDKVSVPPEPVQVKVDEVSEGPPLDSELTQAEATPGLSETAMPDITALVDPGLEVVTDSRPPEPETIAIPCDNGQQPEPGPELIREMRVAEAEADRAASSTKNALPIEGILPRDEEPSVCLIVLHRGGEQHLCNLFTSFLKHNSIRKAEFRVMLHSCSDDSRRIIASFQEDLDIKVTESEENRSFAYSNNRAAEQTSAEYLVFLNNDIIFQDDVVSGLLRILQHPWSGIAGARLLFPADDAKYPNELQHGGVKFRPDPHHFFYRPWNVGAHIDIFQTPPVAEKFPAVTAALAACRRDVFLKVGGFCEDYFYGYEDVDLCLTLNRVLGLRSVSANQISSVHNESATGRLDSNDAIRRRRTNNIHHLIRRHGWFLRRRWLLDKIGGGLFYSDQPLTLAFAVTEASAETAAGDFFSASELGEACAKEFGWKIQYLSRKIDWYDLKEVDVLVVLIDGYELSKMREAKPELVKVAWMRNWFERWACRPDFESYDVFLCSSQKAARWMRESQRKPAIVFPLATNPERFAGGEADDSLTSDYCFTGSNWTLPRDIEGMVQPEKLHDYRFAVFGRGWENHPSLGEHSRGFVPYSNLPSVYASTRVVVDDANHVTKTWGSVNSRVFDALAAGALVVTNGEAGSAELFAGELPSYRSAQDLRILLQKYLGDEKERSVLTERLRQQVLSRHTYRRRARTFKSVLIRRARSSYRIALKIGAPTRSQVQHWGDYHFACSLGRCLAEQGHSYRVDCLDEWDRPEAFGDDVVIALRGLSRYQPKPGQINVMWNISHPDKISDDEYEEYDHVFVASKLHADELAARLSTPVSELLQCTDPYLFYPDLNPAVPAEELLFVGNSRKQYRESVRFAVEAGFPLGVYGTLWAPFIPVDYIRAEYVDNSILRQYYSRCSILLNDHWPSMRDRGFISNRIFDGAAAGAFVLSDRVEGIDRLFGQELVTYDSAAGFRNRVQYYLTHPEERQEEAARLRSHVLSSHTFAHRAEAIIKQVKAIDRLKMDPQEIELGTAAEGSRRKAESVA